MSFFSQGASTFGTTNAGGMFGTTPNTNYNAMKDIEVSANAPSSVHAKPRLSQVNVRQKLYATGRNFGFTCRNDR